MILNSKLMAATNSKHILIPMIAWSTGVKFASGFCSSGGGGGGGCGIFRWMDHPPKWIETVRRFTPVAWTISKYKWLWTFLTCFHILNASALTQRLNFKLASSHEIKIFNKMVFQHLSLHKIFDKLVSKYVQQVLSSHIWLCIQFMLWLITIISFHLYTFSLLILPLTH